MNYRFTLMDGIRLGIGMWVAVKLIDLTFSVIALLVMAVTNQTIGWRI